MKKIVRVKCKSFCPLSNEGVHSSLNEIEDMLDTLSKFERAKQRKPKLGICSFKTVFTTYQTERRFDTSSTTI